MLDIYDDVRAFQRDAVRLHQQIAKHDSDLGRQLRRSAQSIALNIGEGSAAIGGDRRRAYSIALREARECRTAIDVAQEWGYAATPEPDVLDRLDKIIATLWKLVHPARER